MRHNSGTMTLQVQLTAAVHKTLGQLCVNYVYLGAKCNWRACWPSKETVVPLDTCCYLRLLSEEKGFGMFK